MSAEPGKELALASMIDNALTIDQIVKMDEQIKELMQRVMKKDHHYGAIPGVRDGKPTLLKPGAEKILTKFRLATSYIKECRDLGDGYEWVITCRLTHMPTGIFVGEGLGSCSTKEYGKNQVKVNNTVLKIARKRAMIDAVMTATSASDFFTQDVGDKDDDKDSPHAGSKEPEPIFKEDWTKLKGYTELVGAFKEATYGNGYYGFYIDHKRHWTQDEVIGKPLESLVGKMVLVKSLEFPNKNDPTKPSSHKILSVELFSPEDEAGDDIPFPEEPEEPELVAAKAEVAEAQKKVKKAAKEMEIPY